MEICKNCGANFEGEFCNVCGQKKYTTRDRSIKYLLNELFRSITNFEGSFFRTVKTIFTQPGKLTNDYCHGKRKQYFKPVSLYLLIVVTYLIFPLFAGLNMEMQHYKSMPVAGRFITKQIEIKTDRLNITEKQLSERFKEISQSTSKILLFLLIPLSALIIYILYFGKKRLWFDNLILATEMNIVYLLVFYILFPLFYIFILKIMQLPDVSEEMLGLTLTTFFGVYATVVFHNIFLTKWGPAIIKGLSFSFLHALILLLIYKLLVFEVTFVFL